MHVTFEDSNESTIANNFKGENGLLWVIGGGGGLTLSWWEGVRATDRDLRTFNDFPNLCNVRNVNFFNFIYNPSTSEMSSIVVSTTVVTEYYYKM